MKPKKKRRGRPSSIGKVNLRQLRILAGKGFTNEEIGGFFGIARSSLQKYQKQNPKLADTIKREKEVADRRVEKSLFERATGYSHKEDKIFCNNGEIVTQETIKHYPPDPASMIFWLKNRKPDEWKERHELEVKGMDEIFEKMRERYQ